MIIKVCCISAKYYQAKPHLLQPLRQLAIDELEKFPKEKSLEYVQVGFRAQPRFDNCH